MNSLLKRDDWLKHIQICPENQCEHPLNKNNIRFIRRKLFLIFQMNENYFISSKWAIDSFFTKINVDFNAFPCRFLRRRDKIRVSRRSFKPNSLLQCPNVSFIKFDWYLSILYTKNKIEFKLHRNAKFSYDFLPCFKSNRDKLALKCTKIALLSGKSVKFSKRSSFGSNMIQRYGCAK